MAVQTIEVAGLSGWTPTYERNAVMLLTLGFGLVGLDRWIIAPLAPAMIADLGMSPQQINNLIAALGVTWGVAAVLMGGLSDRIGRKKVLIPALLAFSLLSSLSGVAAGFATLLFARGLMGVAEGAFCPTSFASTAEASRPSRRGFNQGLQQSAFALFGLGFGPILATQMLSAVSWRVVFMLVAIPGLLLTVALWRVIREPDFITQPAAEHQSAAKAKGSWRELFAHRNVGLAMVGLFCAMCGIFVLSANIPIYLTAYLHLSAANMGLVTSAIGFGGFVGQWGLPAASDRIGRRAAGIIGFVMGAVLLYGFMQVGANIPLLFGLLFASCAFSFGLLSLLTGPVATEAAPAGRISSTAGLIIGAGEIFGGGLALVVAGIVIGQFGIAAMLNLALGGLSLGGVLMLFLQETAPALIGLASAHKGRGPGSTDNVQMASVSDAIENGLARRFP